MNMPNVYTTSDLEYSLDRCNLSAADVAEVLGACGRGGDLSEWTGGFALRMRDGQFCTITGSCCSTGWGCQDDAKVSYYPSASEALAALGGVPDLAPIDLQRWVDARAPGPEHAAKTVEMSLPVATVLSLLEKVDKARDVARDLEKRLCLAEADAKMAREREQEARTTAALWQAKSDALVEVLLKHGVPSGACFLPIRAADDLLTDLETKLAAALARAEAAEARLAAAASADSASSPADVDEASRVEMTGAFNVYVQRSRAEPDKLRADEKWPRR